MTRPLCLAVLLLSLVAGAGSVPATPAASAPLPAASERRGPGDPPDQDVLIVGGSTVYPNPTDDTEPRETTFSFVPIQSGTWSLKVHFRPTVKPRVVRCAYREAGTESVEWTWNGRDGRGRPAPRGQAFASLHYAVGVGCNGNHVGESDWVTVVNSTGFAWTRDQSDQKKIRNVDLARWALYNSDRKVVAELEFWQRQHRERWRGLYALLGTRRTPRESEDYAYAIWFDADAPAGNPKWSLSWFRRSAGDHGEPVRCRGLENRFRNTRVFVTIPKGCLDHGNQKLKLAVVAVFDRRHVDNGGSGDRHPVHYTKYATYRPVE